MIREIVVQPSARRSLIMETLKSTNIETGGVLCGHYKNDLLIIEGASGPGHKAVQSEIEFVMDKEFMHAYLDQEYSNSVGLHIFAGEWHTHPQTYPEPSPQDVQSIFERSYEWNHGEIIFLIIGFINFSPAKLESQIIGLTVDKTQGKIWRVPVIFF